MDYHEFLDPTDTTTTTTGNKEHKPNSVDNVADQLENGIEKAYEKLSNTDWGSLWSSVRKQGELAISRANSVVKPIANDKSTGEKSQETEGSNTEKGSTNEKNDADDKPSHQGQGKTMLWELSRRAQQYVDELDHEIESLENSAGSYLLKVGKDMRSLLRDAVNVTGPGNADDSDSLDMEAGEDAPPEILFDVPEDIRNRIYSTRLDAQLHALHTSSEPFLTTTQEEGFTTFFKQEFQLNDMTNEISKELEQFPSLRKLMESLVPEKVPYDEFWAKYYYMRNQIKDQEQTRKKLLQTATAKEENIGWDDDEEEEDDQTPKANENKLVDKGSRPPSSEASYDVISKNSAVSPTSDEDEDDWE